MALRNEEIQRFNGGFSGRRCLGGGDVHEGGLDRRAREMAEEGAKVVATGWTRGD